MPGTTFTRHKSCFWNWKAFAVLLACSSVVLPTAALSQNSDQWVADGNHQVDGLLAAAESAYSAGDKAQAQELYRRAVGLGSAEAMFQLAYRFTLPNGENRQLYLDAALQGHERALGYALDLLFYRANSLLQADPEAALELLRTAKQRNSAISTDAPALVACVEAGPFDGAAFLERYGLSDAHADGRPDYVWEPYYVWELAESAASTNRFGEPSASLVLQLVCRGGSVPAELKAAVQDAYERWQTGSFPAFDICQFVGSRIGMNYCRARESELRTKQRSAFDYPAVDDHVWTVKGNIILPSCLQTVWASGDNYEAYQDQFPSAADFIVYPGRYLGVDIPLAPISAWGHDIALAIPMSSCSGVQAPRSIIKDRNAIYIVDPEWSHPEDQDMYRLLAEWGPDGCETVLPQFFGHCESLVYVVRNENTNFRIHYGTYAYVTQNNRDYILPVTNESLEEFLARLAPSTTNSIVSSSEVSVVRFQTNSFRVRIHVTKDTLVYSAWSKSKAPDDEPDLVLTGGRWVSDGHLGNGFYSFTNGDYEYRITTSRAISSSTPPDALIVLRGTQKLLDEPIVSSSPAGFFYQAEQASLIRDQASSSE